MNVHYHVNGREGRETYDSLEVARERADRWQSQGVGCNAYPCVCETPQEPADPRRHCWTCTCFAHNA